VKLVLDTNVLIAAFVARGVCAELLAHCAEAHEIITSEGLLEEYREKLTGKFRLNEDAAGDRVLLLRSVMQVVAPAPLDVPVCRDPDDDLVLATAAAGGCRCIVTGDKDLLVLGTFGEIDILTPGQFSRYEADA
jgi:putative PIN family toxin of toxin-antitoxin system